MNLEKVSQVLYRINWYKILVHCDRFRTPQGHVDHLRSLGWEEAESDWLRNCIFTLIETGNLRSRADFIEKFAGGAIEEPRRITTLAWTTFDGIESLSRSVTSFLDSASQYGWNLRVAVIDNSLDFRKCSESCSILKGIAAASGRDIHYAGQKERKLHRQHGRIAAIRGHPAGGAAFCTPGGFGNCRKIWGQS